MGMSAVRALFRRRPEADSTMRSVLSEKERRDPAYQVLYWVVFLFLLALALTTLFPLWWMFTGPLKAPLEFISLPPTLWPRGTPRWKTYLDAWNSVSYPLYFRNTILIALGTWILEMFVATTAAFSLAKLKPAGKPVLLALFFSTMAVPGTTLLVPRFITVARPPLFSPLLQHLFGARGLIDTWWAIWLPASVSGFNIFLLTLFFERIPDDYVDAARIDGASAWRLFLQIILPLSRPILAVLTINSFMGSWQSFLWPMLVLPSQDSKHPIMVRLYGLADTFTASRSATEMLAAIAIAAIPPLILFVIFQRQIVRGISQTGLTG